MSPMTLKKSDWTLGSQVLERGALDRLEQVGGSALLIRLIDRFIETAPSIFDTACDQGKCGDLKSLGTTAHRLADSAANLGAVALRQGASRLERLCRAGARELALPLLVQMSSLLEEARDRLASEKQGILTRSRTSARQ